MRKILPILLAVALLCSFVTTALAASDNQEVKSTLDNVQFSCTYQEVTYYAGGSKDSRDENSITQSVASKQTAILRLEADTLQGIFEILMKGVVPRSEWEYWDYDFMPENQKWVKSEYVIDKDAPIMISFSSSQQSNYASIVNTFDKKVVLTGNKEEDGIGALNGEEVITVYNGSVEGITITSRSSRMWHSTGTIEYPPEENQINFTKGLEIRDGAVLNIKTDHVLGESSDSASHRCIVTIGEEDGAGAGLTVNGGKLNLSGLNFIFNEGYSQHYEWPSSTYLKFNNASMTVSNGGAVALDGVQVEGTAPAGKNLVTVGENGSLTVEDGKTYSNGAPSNITVTDETPAVKCEAGSSLTLSGSSTVTSDGDKAVDLEKGAKVTTSDGKTHTVGDVADAFVDNGGFLVEKENEGDLIPKVDATEVVEPEFDDSISEDSRTELKTAVGGITADLPTEEQATAAKSFAQEPDSVKAEFGNAVNVENEEIYVHVLTTVETKVEEYNKTAGILTLDITPYYQVIASTAPDRDDIHLTTVGEDTKNAVTLKEKTVLNVTTPVEMSIPVPDGFNGSIGNIIVLHEHNGKINRYDVTVLNKKVTFTIDGFSTFKLIALKNGTLKDLTSSAGTMETFDPSKEEKTYTVSVPYSVKELTLTATKVASADTVTAEREEGEVAVTGGSSGTSGTTITVPDLEVGENTVTIKVTHESAETTYIVTIKRDAYVPPAPSSYSVKVEEVENAEVELSATSATAGTEITVTVTPDENYHVSGLTVTAANGAAVAVTDNKDGTYTFTMPASNVTVAAEVYECPSLAFPDIDLTEWYHEGVDYAIAHNLMRGIDVGVFAPEKTVTRAEMAGILWNLEGQPEVEAEIPFPDVAENEWYTEAIRWAASAGIIKGYDTGNFGPNDTITREQMAAMLYFYEQKIGSGGFAEDDTFDLTFDDAAEISDWAREAVAWCTIKGVITGSENKFNPADTSKRSDLATILALYDKLAK